MCREKLFFTENVLGQKLHLNAFFQCESLYGKTFFTENILIQKFHLNGSSQVWGFIWSNKDCFWVNALLPKVHFNWFSPVWALIWVDINFLTECLNTKVIFKLFFSHVSLYIKFHLKGFSPVWFLLWLFNWLSQAKPSSHKLHLQGSNKNGTSWEFVPTGGGSNRIITQIQKLHLNGFLKCDTWYGPTKIVFK